MVILQIILTGIFIPYSSRCFMKRALSFVIVFLLLTGTFSFSQSPTSVPAFLKKIEADPDSIRFEKLSEFVLDLADQLHYVEADQVAGELSKIADQTNSIGFKGRVHMSAAYIAKQQNDKTVAINNYQKAQQYFQKSGDVKREIRSFQRIGMIYISNRDVTHAQQYIERAFKLAQNHKMEDEIANLYTDKATIEDIRGDFNLALDYNQKAVDLYKKMGEDHYVTLFNRGIILKNAGRFNESIHVYEECLAYAQRTNFKEMLEMIYVNMPLTLLQVGDTDRAEAYAKKALELAPASFNKLVLNREAYDILSKVAVKRQAFEKAYDYQQKWIVYRDSIFDLESNRQLVEAESKFQVKEKQQEIHRLDQENAERRLQLFWLSAGLLLLAVVLFIAVWQYLVIKRVNGKLETTNATLQTANQQINKQSFQLKELMQELHHRVKNNLAIVSSLLSLQADRLDDQKAALAVMEGQQRVEAMSLIHNQLYLTDNVTGVNMQEYVADLTTGLMQSFRQKDSFQMNLDIAPIVLDVELAVPIGLIINELTTNAFKHAYKEVEDAELSIRLWNEDKMYLEIRDNGPGIAPEDWQKTGDSFGKRLIKSLTKQAKGQIAVFSESGSRFLLSFPKSVIVGPQDRTDTVLA